MKYCNDYAALLDLFVDVELTPAEMAAVRTLSVPMTLVFTASMGKNSQEGTCFNAAAWKM